MLGFVVGLLLGTYMLVSGTDRGSGAFSLGLVLWIALTVGFFLIVWITV